MSVYHVNKILYLTDNDAAFRQRMKENPEEAMKGFSLSQEEHDASLTVEGAGELIKKVMPLLAGSPEKIDLLPVGGKGLSIA